MKKTILDACCGGKQFWFQPNNEHTVFCDIRSGEFPMCDGRVVKVNPDVVCSFCELPFENNTFDLIVFDPPHIKHLGEKSFMKARFGSLGEDWMDLIKSGAGELFRVLKHGGTLIFKWNETSIKVDDVVKLFPIQPMFGHKSGKLAKTHWLCFYKP